MKAGEEGEGEFLGWTKLVFQSCRIKTNSFVWTF